MPDTFTPRSWDAAANQGAPAPYIPTLRGLTMKAYADSLISMGIERDTGDGSEGKGYGECLSAIADPATGIVGYVTQWEWNSPVRWEIWTEHGVERRGRSDVHIWPWDAVKTVRLLLAQAAFKAGQKSGEIVGYWAEAQDAEAARAAHAEWAAARIASYR